MGDEQEMILVPKGGRPKKAYSATLLEQLLIERTTFSVKEMAKLHKISVPTMYRMLKAAKEYKSK